MSARPDITDVALSDGAVVSDDALSDSRMRGHGWGCTDLANAQRLYYMFKDTLAYVPSQGWFVFDGQRWVADNGGPKGVPLKVKWLAQQVPRYIFEQAAELKSNGHADRAEDLWKWGSHTASTNAQRALLDQAISLPGIHADWTRFDQCPNWLNCANGTVDLRTGELHAHDPEDFLTQYTSTVFDPSATCPGWLDFVEWATCGDTELAQFLQKLMGYALTGYSTEHVMALWLGGGRNGKGTFVDVVRHVMGGATDDGGYVHDAAWSTFERSKNAGGGGSQRFDLYGFYGSRLVVTAEPHHGAAFDTSLLKAFASDDTIKGDRKYMGSKSFKPSFLTIIPLNMLPVVGESSHAVWERLVPVPFNATVAPGARERGIVARLQSEASGVLNWLIEGAQAWYRDGGLNPYPAAVENLRRDYREDENRFTDFYVSASGRGEIVDDADGLLNRKDAWLAYQAWAEWTKVANPFGKNRFYREFEQSSGVKVARRDGDGKPSSSGERHYLGVRLATRDEGKVTR